MNIPCTKTNSSFTILPFKVFYDGEERTVPEFSVTMDQDDLGKWFFLNLFYVKSAKRFEYEYTEGTGMSLVNPNHSEDREYVMPVASGSVSKTALNFAAFSSLSIPTHCMKKTNG